MRWKQNLTGIERQLVLDYLRSFPVQLNLVFFDGDGKTLLNMTVVTVPCLAEESSCNDFIAVDLSCCEQPLPEKACVRVMFYYNQLGLFFDSELKSVSCFSGFLVPACINRIFETKESSEKEFSAVIFYGINKNKSDFAECRAEPGYSLFSPQNWDCVPAGALAKTKLCIKKILQEASERKHPVEKGSFLIPVGMYLSNDDCDSEMEPFEGKVYPPGVIYIDQKKIVFAASSLAMRFSEFATYEVSLKIPLSPPLIVRTIDASCVIEMLCKNDKGDRCCAVARFTNLKEEDFRFLSEKKSL